MNIHYANPGLIITDSHGSYAKVLCGAEGSYYSHQLPEINCSLCLEILANDKPAMEAEIAEWWDYYYYHARNCGYNIQAAEEMADTWVEQFICK